MPHIHTVEPYRAQVAGGPVFHDALATNMVDSLGRPVSTVARMVNDVEDVLWSEADRWAWAAVHARASRWPIVPRQPIIRGYAPIGGYRMCVVGLVAPDGAVTWCDERLAGEPGFGGIRVHGGVLKGWVDDYVDAYLGGHALYHARRVDIWRRLGVSSLAILAALVGQAVAEFISAVRPCVRGGVERDTSVEEENPWTTS